MVFCTNCNKEIVVNNVTPYGVNDCFIDVTINGVRYKGSITEDENDG